MKIKKPFAYFGSKGRMYKEIREIFLESEKNNVVDLFAGGMEVALNLKEEFGANVTANVKDVKLEELVKKIKSNKLYDFYIDVADKLFLQGEKKCVRHIFLKDKKQWLSLKENFTKILGSTQYINDEKELIILLFGFGGKGSSLSSSCYSESKRLVLERYSKAVNDILVTTNYFSEKEKYKNSFIILDPPYIASTRAGVEKKGHQYTEGWNEKDDERLIEFIRSNKNFDNVFLVFGSVGNNLQKLIEHSFPSSKIEVKKYKKQIFGKVSERAEWYCVIK